MGKPTTSLSRTILKARNDPEYQKRLDEQRKTWWAEHKDKHRSLVRAWYHRLLPQEKRGRFARGNQQPSRIIARLGYVWRWRVKTMEALGGTLCCKCGYDADFRALTVDHVNGGGQAEFRAFNFNLVKLLKTIIAMPEAERRERYQVLCANCNRIKQFDQKEFGRGRPRM